MSKKEILEFIVYVVSCALALVAIGGFVWFIWWGCYQLLHLPYENSTRCRGIAETRGSEHWASSGWTNDTCYIYLNGEERRVEL